MFNQIISDLRKGCNESYKFEGTNRKPIKIPCGQKDYLCIECQAKLDQTLICEKIANEEKPITNIMLDNEVQRLEQKHKDFVEKLLYWIDNCTSQQGKYFMSLGIDKLKDKIKELEKL